MKNTESESRLIVENIPGLIALMSPAGEIEMVNRQLLQYFGQTLEELKLWRTNDTVHPEDLPHVIDVFSQSIAIGSPYETLQRYKRADGAYRWLQNRAFPLRDTEGNITRWCCLLTDIHDQKRAEEALRESEAFLLDAQHLSHTGSWKHDLVSNKLTFTPEIERIYAITPQDDRSSTDFFFNRIHPEDREAERIGYMHAINEKRGFDSVFRIVLPDGSIKYIHNTGRAQLNEAGDVVGFLGTAMDLTEQHRVREDLEKALAEIRQSEAKLRRKEEFLTKAQRLSLSGSFSWLVETNEVTLSEGARRIFAFEIDFPVTLETIAGRIHPDDRPLLAEKIGGAHLAGGDQEYGIRLQMPDGTIKYLLSSAQETRDASGQREYIGAVQDVTARHLAEKALDKARSELAHVSRVTSLNAMTASIAHEINQPLSGIVTNANTCLRMLNADLPNLDGARDTARRTIRDGKRASDVITRLRTLFSKKEFVAEPVDLNEAAREVIALSLSELQRNGAILHHEFADRLPIIHGDRIQLQQVILNLVRNASDAMSGIEDRPRRLLIRTEQADANVCLAVQDSGIGFDTAITERLFESFYTTKPEGMGIGLSVSRSIIEAHHGRLWATVNDGPGATFAFSIPCDTLQTQTNNEG